MRLLFIAAFFLSCNTSTQDTPVTNSASAETSAEQSKSGAKGDCNALYLFRLGAKITQVSYDGEGKEISRALSEVTDVKKSTTGYSSTVRIDANSTDGPTSFETFYTCDGRQIYFDVKSLMGSIDKQNIQVEDAKISFPLDLQVGQKLEDAGFTMMVGGSMKMDAKIKNREVKSLEKLNTPGGNWDCYKITATLESKMTMLGADAETNARMQSMQDNMPTSTYSYWFAPDFGIVQILIYSGDKLQLRSVVEKVE